MIDHDAFADDVLDTNAFAQTAAWTPSGGSETPLVGIFDNAYVAIQGLGDAGVASSTPAFLCKTSDAPTAKRGDVLVVDSTTYYIHEVQPDGDGFTVLILSKDA